MSVYTEKNSVYFVFTVGFGVEVYPVFAFAGIKLEVHGGLKQRR